MKFATRVALLAVLLPALSTGCEKEPQAFVEAFFGKPDTPPTHPGAEKQLKPGVPDMLFVVLESDVALQAASSYVQTLWLYSLTDKTLRPSDVTAADFMTRHHLTPADARRHIVTIRGGRTGSVVAYFEYFFGLSDCNSRKGTLSLKTPDGPLLVSSPRFNCCF